MEVVFAVATAAYVASGLLYFRAAALTRSLTGRLLFGAQLLAGFLLALGAFDADRRAALVWLAYAFAASMRRVWMCRLSFRSGVAPRGLAKGLFRERAPL